MQNNDKPIDINEIGDYETLPTLELPESKGQRRRRSGGNKELRKFFKFLKRSFRLRFILIGIVVVVIVGSLSLAALITDSIARLNSSTEGLNRVVSGIGNTSGTELTLSDFNRIQSSLSDLSEQIATTQNRVGLLGPIPSFNPDWQASVEALAVSEELTDAALAMLSGLQPALDYMVQGDEEESVTTGISSGQRVVELLELGRGRFLTAENSLRFAEARLNEIDLSNVSTDILLQVETLRAYHSQLLSFNSALLNAPNILTTMMGLDGQRTYLVLAQNNDEIRPSGGYISTYGWFTVDGGRIINFDYSPTTATSPNPPDEDFANRFEIPSWWVRYGEPVYAAWDGSWYADFPSTAQLAMDYYNAGGNPQSPVDGVLAIDISGFELMLEAIGDVRVPTYNVVVNASNFRRIVYDIRAFGQGVTPHKEFVASVYRAIFDEWSSLDQSRTPALLGALLEGVQGRHIMIYFADDEVNQVIAQLGWNGAQASGASHDYLLVADANLGNKSNNSVIRSLTYDVQINTDNSVTSRLGLRYDYFDSIASNDPAVDEEYHGRIDYNNLMQVFLPRNATVNNIENLNALTVGLEEHTLLVGRTSVVYDSSERYTFEYQTTNVIDTLGDYQRYRLLVQKQAGARLQLMNIQIALPANARLISSNPSPDANYALENPILNYRLELDSDIWIEVIYQAD